MGSAKTAIATLVFFAGLLTSSSIVFGGFTIFTDDINMLVFKRHHITSDSDKIWLIKTLTLWISLFLLALAILTMFCRILMGGQAKNPAKGQDPQIIQTLNRIISNTIQQSIIFGALFGNILYDVDDNSLTIIGDNKVLAMASLFVIGRVLFTIGYLLCWITGLSTWRSFGFGINLSVCIIMGLYFIRINVFEYLKEYKIQNINLQ